MKYLALLALFVCPAFAQMCVPGPPYYCASTSTANPGNITAPFSVSTPQNSVAEDLTIPGHIAGTERITRITDPTTTTNGQFVGNGTCSAGDNDRMISAWETYLGVVWGGSTSIFHLSMANGTIQVVNSGKPPGIRVPCPFGFSWTNDSRFYYYKGTTLHQGDITSDSTYTDTVLADISTCPNYPAGTFIAGIMGISDDDDSFSGMLNPRTQGSGDAAFVWSRTKGCQLVNFASFPAPPTAACWGSQGALGWGIHDLELSGDGQWLYVAGQGPWLVGTTPANPGACVWQVGTLNTQICSNPPKNGMACGAHMSVGISQLLSPGTGNVPQTGPTIRALSDVAQFTNFFPYMGIHDWHASWAHDDNGTFDDAMPWVGAGDEITLSEGSGCASAVYCPVFKQGEIFALFPNRPGVIKTFSHTFECGIAPATTFAQCSDGVFDAFGPNSAIGVVSPRGHYFCWVSSMLHQLENDRADEFCVVLQ